MSITLTLIAQIIAFVILIWLVNQYMWAPLSTMMEDRRTKIAEGLAASEAGQHALVTAEAEAQKVIDEAKSQAAEIVASARTRETQIVEEAKETAQAEAGRIKAAAEAELEQEVNRAKEALRGQVSELAVAGASRILKKEVSADAHNDALKDLIEQI